MRPTSGRWHPILLASTLALIVAPAYAQLSANDVVISNPRVAVLDAEQELLAARTGDDAVARKKAEDRLASACARFGFPETDTCLSIAHNEKWISAGTRGCVITAGRAWGCEPDAFANAPAAQ